MRVYIFVFLCFISSSISVFSQTMFTILSEGFESSASIPTGWTQEAVSGTDVWSINNGGYFDNGTRHPSSAKTGSRNAYLFSTSTTRKLVSPQLDLSGLGNISLKFWEARMKFGNDTDQLKVYYKTAPTGSWNLLATYSNPTSGWVERTVTLPNPGATYYIAFEGIARYGYGICIDDVLITAFLANDAAVSGVSVLNKDTIRARITNFGANNMTSVKINYKIGSGSTNTFNWSGNLSTNNSQTVSIGAFNFPHGESTITVWTTEPNAGGDGNRANDTMIYKYILIKDFPYRETFETADLGGWKQSKTDDFDWTRYSGSTPTPMTGPTSAYHGSFYMYTYSGSSSTLSAELISVDFDISRITNPYLEVWYHMYGPQIGSLHFGIDSSGQQKMGISQSITGQQGNMWLKKLIPLDSFRYLNNFIIRGIAVGFWGDMAIDDVKVLDIPYFSLGNDTSFCYGDSFTMEVDTGYGYSFLWKNNTTGDTLSFTNKLTVFNTGTYSLTINAPYGYSHTDSLRVTLKPNPVASFSMSDSFSCLRGNNISFNNLSSISQGTLSYIWDFGDKDTSHSKNSSHSYRSSDSFNVQLIAISDYGCKDTTAKTIRIYPNPQTAFTINDTSQCLNNNFFSFTDQSSISQGTLDSFHWTFGDAASASTKNTTHQYSSPAQYDVKLLLTSDKNCKDSLTQKVVVNPEPLAAFSINDSSQCFTANSFAFTNSSSISSGQINNFFWNFGNGNSSSQQHSSHTYAMADSYTVKLRIVSDKGCSDSTVKTVYVHPQPLAAMTLSDTSLCLRGNSISFNNTSSISVGQIDKVVWNFGDNNSSTLNNPAHSYNTASTYVVKLIVESDKGCKDSTSRSVYVRPMPTAAFNLQDFGQCIKNNRFQFNNTSGISSGTLSYQWDFGDAISSGLTAPVHIYNDTGNFHVKLIATSGFGCQDSVSHIVSLYPMPKAVFSINDSLQCLSGNKFVFQNYSSVSKGVISTHHWNFGDDGTSSLQHTDYTYTKEGEYLLRLIVVSDKSCRDTFVSKLSVYPMPQADFYVPQDSQCIGGNKYIFNNNSMISSGSLQYLWDFGDGDTSTMKEAEHRYLTDGSFEVKLLSVSDKNCKDSMSRNVYVAPGAVANFSINQVIQCFTDNSFEFLNLSFINDGTMTLQWDLGDGTLTTTEHPVHSYAIVDSYTVKLVALSDHLCSDSISQMVYVKPMPKADFELLSDSIQCYWGNKFEFNNNSFIDEGNISYSWNFGDEDQSSQREPIKSYQEQGKFMITLIVSSYDNCIDSGMLHVEVLKLQPLYLGADTTIEDTSTILLDAGSDFLSYKWQDNSSEQSFEVIAKDFGTGVHNFFVHVTDSNNCFDADTVIITIVPAGNVGDMAEQVLIRLYPNPADNYVIYELEGNMGQIVNVELFSMEGKQLTQRIIDKQDFTTTGTFDLSDYPKGTYMIRFSSDRINEVSKFIKR